MPWAVAAPIAGAVVSSALASGDQGANTSTGSATNQGAFQSLIPVASNVIRDYITRTAPTSYSTNANAVAMLGASPLNSSDINQYLSPYLNDVANQANTRAKQFLTEQALPAIQDSFISAGQPGSSRQEDFDTRALRDVTTNLQANLGSIFNTGFMNAANIANEQKRNLLAAASPEIDIANSIMNSALATGQGTGSSTSQQTGPSPSIAGSALGGALLGSQTNVGPFLQGILNGSDGGSGAPDNNIGVTLGGGLTNGTIPSFGKKNGGRVRFGEGALSAIK